MKFQDSIPLCPGTCYSWPPLWDSLDLQSYTFVNWLMRREFGLYKFRDMFSLFLSPVCGSLSLSNFGYFWVNAQGKYGTVSSIEIQEQDWKFWDCLIFFCWTVTSFFIIFIRFVFVLSKKAQGQLSWSSVEYNSVVCHLHLLSNVLGVIVQYFIKIKNGSNELHSNSTAMLTCVTSLYGRPLLSVKVCHVRRLV